MPYSFRVSLECHRKVVDFSRAGPGALTVERYYRGLTRYFRDIKIPVHAYIPLARPDVKTLGLQGVNHTQSNLKCDLLLFTKKLCARPVCSFIHKNGFKLNSRFYLEGFPDLKFTCK